MASVSSIARDSLGGLPERMRDTQATFSGLVRRCHPPATCTTCTPLSARRSRSSSSAAVSFPPSRSPTNRLSSFKVSGRSLAKSRLSMMLASRPGATAGGGSGAASSPAVRVSSPPVRVSSPAARVSRSGAPASAACSPWIIEAAASSASSCSLPTFVGPSQVSSGCGPSFSTSSAGAGPTWVSGSAPPKGSSADCSADCSAGCPGVTVGPERSGLVRSASAGPFTTPPASCSLVFLRLLILLLILLFDRSFLTLALALALAFAFALDLGGGRGRRLAGVVDRNAGRLGDEQGLAIGRLQHAHHLEARHLQDGHQRDHHQTAQLRLGEREVEAGLELE